MSAEKNLYSKPENVIIKKKLTCKFGPWLASIYLALQVPSQQLNDK